MAYALTTAFLMHMHRRRNRKNFNSLPTEIFDVFELVILAGLSVLVGIARVYLGYHSVDQVMAGMMLGSGFSALWFLLIAAVHSTGTARAIQRFFSPLLHLKSDWDHDYVDVGKLGNISKKLR
jgi:membrane-associated phospholipid phosphatase